jgi:hypothetical protein
MRFFGGVQLASVNDVGRLMTETKMHSTFKNLPEYLRASVHGKNPDELRKMLGVYETVLNSRYSLYADIAGAANAPTRLTRFEKWMHAAEKQLGTLTILNQHNQTMKTAAAINVGDYIANLGMKARQNKLLSKREELRAGEILIGSKDVYRDLARIGEQFEKNGGTINLTKYLNTDAWDDTARPLANRLLDGLKKDINQTITTINPASMPVWAEGPIGRQIVHLRTFDLASTTMFLGRQLQMGDAQAVAAFAEMITIGALIGVLRRAIGGRDLHLDNVGFLIGDGFDRSGAGGLFGQVSGIMDRSPLGAGVTGILGGRDATKSLRYGERNPWGVVFGPAGALGEDIGKGVFKPIANLSYGKPIDRYQGDAFLKLLPYNNLWYLQPGLNVVKEGAYDALGIKKKTRGVKRGR